MEISDVVDKLPLLPKDGVHFGFGFDIPQATTRVDIPWGVMEVEKDQWAAGNRNWLALQRWLDISNGKDGLTWCSLDAPLFELVAIANERVSVSILKPSADGKVVILRLRSVSDREDTAKLAWPAGRPKSVCLCKRNEDAGERVGDEIAIPANRFVTLRLGF